MPNIQSFDAGINTRIDPSLIPVSAAQELNNVDPNAGIIKSLKNYNELPNIVKPYFINYNNEWLSKQTETEFVEYRDVLYQTGENMTPVKYNGTEYQLGINKPLGNIDIDIEVINILSNINLPNRIQESNMYNRPNSNYVTITVNFRTVLFYKTIPILQDLGGVSSTTVRVPQLVSLDDDDRANFKAAFGGGSTNARILYYYYLFADNVLPLSSDFTLGLYSSYNNSTNYRFEGRSYAIQNAISDGVWKVLVVVLPIYRDISGTLDEINNPLNYVRTRDRNQLPDIDIENKLIINTQTVTLNYVYTYYDQVNDIESAPSDIFPHILDYTALNSISGQIIDVVNNSMSETIPDNVTHKRIYRLGGYFTSFTLIDTILKDEINFTDYINNDNVIKVLESGTNYSPETNMRYIVQVYGIFFGIVNDRVVFSKIAQPDAWPLENSILLQNKGTGLLVIPQGLLVFTETETYILTGTSFQNFALTLVSETQGCLKHHSAKIIRSTPVWISYDGICTLQNGYIQVLTKPLLGKTTINSVSSVVYDEQYMILKTDGTILAIDFRQGIRLYTMSYDKLILGLQRFKDKLYFVIENDKLVEAFLGVEDLPIRYVSPLLTDGDHSNNKVYTTVYIKINGAFNIKMYVDNELAIEQTVEGNKLVELKPKIDRQRGCSCYFVITGKGKIYSINTNPLPRQNGE